MCVTCPDCVALLASNTVTTHGDIYTPRTSVLSNILQPPAHILLKKRAKISSRNSLKMKAGRYFETLERDQQVTRRLVPGT
jgi:hypothetical protein